MRGTCGGGQVYGFGFSEEFIGQFMRETGAKPAIATKLAPLPWRFTQGSVVDACKCAPPPSPPTFSRPGAPVRASAIKYYCCCTAYTRQAQWCPPLVGQQSNC